MKKLMLGALAALCAMLALPAFASATPAHVTPQPENFTVTGGPSDLTRVAGGTTSGTSVTGTGSFENTTTGTVNLTFHEVKAENTFTCTTAGQTTPGTVVTTALPFHLIMIETNVPGILITGKPTVPKTETDHFASFNCGIFVGNVVVKGTGVIGTITKPKCGEESTTATLKFERDPEKPGVQKHRLWTGNEYDLKSQIGGGAWSTSAMEAEATINFGATPRTLVCTH